jgi:O-antigen/teichoic acid export membrane protein
MEAVRSQMATTLVTSEKLQVAGQASVSADDSPAQLEYSAAAHSVASSIARGALALLTVQPLSWAISLLSAIVGPRLLGSDLLGQLTTAMTITGIVTTLSGLGVSDYLVRRFAQKPELLKRDQGTALALGLVTAVIGVIIVAIGGWLFASAIVDYRLLLVASLNILAAPLQAVLLATLRGRELHRGYALFTAATNICCTTAGMLVLFIGGDGVAFLATTVGVFAATILVCWKIWSPLPRLPALNVQTISEARHLVKAGFPFLTWAATQMVYSQIDRVLLAAMVPAAEVGWYAAAARIIAIPLFIPTIIVTPLLPALSRSSDQPDLVRGIIAQTLRFVLIVTVPLAAGAIVISPIIPGLFGWPADFANTVAPMSVLALQLPLVSVGMVLGTTLMAVSHERRLVFVAIVATTVNVVANLIAIPYLQDLTGNGSIGAALSTVASEIVMVIGALVFIPKRLLDARTIWVSARVTAAGVATVVAGTALLPVSVPLGVLAGALAYFTVAASTRVLTIEDIRQLAARLGHR